LTSSHALLFDAPPSEDPHQVFGAYTDIFENLSEETRRYVATLVIRDGRYSAIAVPELFMRPALTNLDEPEFN
jgi:hypothetical protein